ncbi:MAG: hypothetical protein JNK53_04105, partial [Phycisphaerae bacterium]|nr:hypothetical protein [Phycisphaerae bacterium]
MPSGAPTDRRNATGQAAAAQAVDLRDRLLSYLRKNHADICRHWFDHVEVLGVDQGGMVLLMEEPVRLSYLQRCCTPPFTE